MNPRVPPHQELQQGRASQTTPNRLTVNRQEAAVMLGISERLLWTWTKSGMIPHVRIGTRVLYPVEQLRIWLNKKANGTVAQTDQ